MPTSGNSVDGRRRTADTSLTPELASSLLFSDHHQSSKEVKEKERCPRCESRDTKFCYYNNYNTSQPRHFCRSCRRYWTLGGSLRNVPIGGSSRNNAHNNARNTTNKRLRPNPNPKPKSNPNSRQNPNPNPNINQSSTRCFLPPPPPPLLEPFRFDLGLGVGVRGGAGRSASIEDMGFELGPTTLVWPSSLLVEGGGIAHHDCFNAVPAAVSAPGEGTAGPTNGGGARSGGGGCGI